ncbi:hypothetical protein OAD14_03620 [Flavobacteriaceae bacterium]|nr:hypothetical protein [Flavobacteriaceae bacterium]MDB9911915.1 hypothetical protein [Flavobacteriaceae bacterium]
MKQERKENTTQTTELLSRGDAIKKIGGYAALTALGTFMILNPQKAQAASAPTDPGGGGGFACADGDPNTCCPECYDGLPRTECPSNECAGSIDSNGDCDTGTPCPPPEPFQGNDNTTTKFNFESKYKSKYKSKYTKK